ncbi:endolytic transglycosylase MltG [Candidatus Kaiserbacteria bacterium]|nr:endolytic transglycosylase MltG [Candidatus Kaiserbacteria bacterium]
MSEPINQFSPSEEFIPNTSPPKKRYLLKLFLGFFVFFVIAVICLYAYVKNLNQPSLDFPSNQPITIEQGTDIRQITQILESFGIVKSKHLLYYTLVFFYDPTQIKASTYVFEEPITTKEVAKRLAEGDFDTDLIRFTHFEGERFTLLAKRAEAVLPEFSSEEFIKEATERGLEGRLYPETYFVPETFDEIDLLNLLTQTFDEEISNLQDEINSHALTLEEILVLASIIEREANSPDSMKLVSSVLQNRLEIGMALQADASIEYVLDKPLKELTPEDLKIDSPYNTYLYTGLPPTPIGNPGLDAIMAVLQPAESEYFYYITDEEGEFHYAKTYKEHLSNIGKYLK